MNPLNVMMTLIAVLSLLLAFGFYLIKDNKFAILELKHRISVLEELSK